MTGEPEGVTTYSKTYLRWALLIFFLISFFNYLDRLIAVMEIAEPAGE